MDNNLIDRTMKKGLSEKVFPGAVLLVAKKDSISFCKAYGYADIFSEKKMTLETFFDLASLTKPLATTLAIMKLVESGKISLDTKVSKIIPEFGKAKKENIAISDLLYHISGLPAYREYYKILAKLPFEKRHEKLRKTICDETLQFPVGTELLYSDIGFMTLCWVSEIVSDTTLPDYILKKLYKPLDIKLFFVDTDRLNANINFASTEKCPWRKKVLNGVVHDENAYVVGGVEGHAGLFGRIADIYKLILLLVEIFAGGVAEEKKRFEFKKETLINFFRRNRIGGRAAGFDAPAQKNSSCGNYFSYNSIGHLGFTGTSFWIDLDKEIIVILLTNRIHPVRSNEKIKAFRPLLHDIIMKGYDI